MTYPGVYRAKVIATGSDRITVVIPQVFSDIPVVIESDYIIGDLPEFNLGDRPEAEAMGFVSFVSGEAEWPVWMGAVAT